MEVDRSSWSCMLIIVDQGTHCSSRPSARLDVRVAFPVEHTIWNCVFMKLLSLLSGVRAGRARD